MKNLKFIAQTIVFVFITSIITITHAEAPKGGLFVNLTTDKTIAESKAIMFAHKKVLKKGYKPVVIWLNVRGIHLANKNIDSYFNHKGQFIHGMLKDFIKDGGMVIACSACSKAQGLQHDDFVDGVKMGNPKLVLELLFDPMVKTLSW